MKFTLQGGMQVTPVPAELLEIYQPVIGFEAVSVWINLYHFLLSGGEVLESDVIQQMSITQKSFQVSLKTLAKYGLLRQEGKGFGLVAPSLAHLQEQIRSKSLAYELERRFLILLEAFCLKSGQAPGPSEARDTTEDSNQVTEHLADEFATRFIKECKFVPSRQLRERFDMWFEQIQDQRLLEELLKRTREKVDLEGSKGCPSRYTDKIVRQWLVQGIKTYEDLLRSDQEFQARNEFYRVVEKELGRGYNTLTPAEKEVVDRIAAGADPGQLARLVKGAILSGEYQGKGAPGIAFVEKWLQRQKKTGPQPAKKKEFTHEHELTDLEKLVKRKTMASLEDEVHEG